MTAKNGKARPMGDTFLDRIANGMNRGGFDRGRNVSVRAAKLVMPDGKSVTNVEVIGENNPLDRIKAIFKNGRGLDSVKDLFEHPNARRGRRNGAEE